MAPNTSYSTLLVTTIRNQSPKIFNNVVTNNGLARHLKAKGNVRIVSGGTKFTHPVLYAKNSSFASISKMGTIDLPTTDPISASDWDIKVLAGSIVLPDLDVAMNSGSKEKLLDYANAKKLEAETSMSELLGDQVFASSPGANDFDSIPKIIEEDPSTSTVEPGGISGSVYSWWRNYSYDTTVTGFNSASAGINAIDTSVNNATKGIMGPKLIVTTSSIFTLYMIGLSSQARYTSMESGDAAFRELMYGTMPFIIDDNCPSGNLYGIDTDSIRMQVLAQGDFKQTPFRFAEQQLAQSALFYLYANLTCGSRRTNFVIDSITG